MNFNNKGVHMGKKLAFILIAILIPATMFSLNPVKTAITYTGEGSVNVEVELYDYGAGSSIYTETIGSKTANSSGIISFFIGIDSTKWANIAASNIDGQWVVNISVDDNLYSQKRLDELIQLQAIAGGSETNFPNGDEIGDLATTIVFQAQGTVYDGNDLHPDHPDGTVVHLYSTTTNGSFQDADGHIHHFNPFFDFELYGPGVIVMKHKGSWYIVGQTYNTGQFE